MTKIIINMKRKNKEIIIIFLQIIAFIITTMIISTLDNMQTFGTAFSFFKGSIFENISIAIIMSPIMIILCLQMFYHIKELSVKGFLNYEVIITMISLVALISSNAFILINTNGISILNLGILFIYYISMSITGYLIIKK